MAASDASEIRRPRGRRMLDFERFDEVLAEVERLRDGGYERVGRWDLARTCRHLAKAFDGSIDGIGGPLPKWLVRLVGPAMKRRILRTRRMPTGVPVPAGYAPPEGLEVDAEVERLRAAIARFEAHEGPFSFHPAFGEAGRADWEQSHLIHCAHHLGFLVPEAVEGPGGAAA